MEEDWENLFDFSIDDHVLLSLDSEFQQPFSTVVNPVVSEPANPSSDDGSDRVRKRDPRLTCENFLAGRIPCSCPEEDERDDEEEGVRKKRARVTVARCQVPGCEADISELKGYHKRHKVCLRCANAATVVLDGQAKRYCQQCGKFHILPDFDEDKRSCRRKLEKHNRRRRKSVESKSGAEDLQGNMLPEDAACDGDAGKDIFNGVSGGIDGFCLGNQIIDTETLLELESAHGSPFHNTAGQTNIGARNIQSNSTLSSVASGEPQTDASIDNSRSALSSSLCANKTTYTSVCPTGRMSFKLYDWNPAEFPRRLRHQIFQWLSSMPVELEGYIRPGCTILTVFIAMPRFMWDELLGDAAAFLDDLISAPESLLSGRDNMLIYLNNAVFQVLKDGTSLIKRTMEMQAPRLHYVYPICFEVGKPMEFIACGSYLSQPKFRFLVSFAGKYLKYDYCLAIPHPKTVLCNGIKGDSDHGSNHQIFKIFIPPMETEIFGPAFIEVENESGISNFIPVLLGDGQICYELQMIQEKIGESFHPKNNGSQLMAMCSYSDPCAVLVSKQAAMSELLLDIGWLLKEPQLEKDETLFTLTQIQRLNRLLYFLIESSSVSILEKILQSLGNGVCIEEFHGPLNNTNDVDLKSFKKYLSRAREILHQNVQGTADNRTLLHSETTQASTLPASDFETLEENHQDMEMGKEDTMCFEVAAKSNWAQESDERTSLLKEKITMDVNHSPRPAKRFAVPQPACVHLYPRIPRRQFFFLVIASVAICCGLCLVFLHPHKMEEFAISVRRCLFGKSKL